ncbi:MAG TPA: hypothetical protein VGK13_06160 [Methanocellaceae archaeon]|jgi:hypothetical protein
MPGSRKSDIGEFKGNFRGGVAGEYATPSKIGRDESKYFGEGNKSAKKTCPTRKKEFVNFATIAPSDTELQYYCPLCDALVAREFDDEGTRKTEVYDWEHTAE